MSRLASACVCSCAVCVCVCELPTARAHRRVRGLVTKSSFISRTVCKLHLRVISWNTAVQFSSDSLERVCSRNVSFSLGVNVSEARNSIGFTLRGLFFPTTSNWTKLFIAFRRILSRRRSHFGCVVVLKRVTHSQDVPRVKCVVKSVQPLARELLHLKWRGWGIWVQLNVATP